MRNVSDKSCREYQNTHFKFSDFLFENRDVSAIMWKNTVEPERPQMTIWRMRISRWVPKATHTPGICNINCFSATTMFARKRLYVMLHVHCRPCYVTRFLLFWCRIHLWFHLIGGVCTRSRWRHSVTVTLKDGGYVLLWQRYDNNKMADMCYYGNVMTTRRWRICVTMETLWQQKLTNKFSLRLYCWRCRIHL